MDRKDFINIFILLLIVTAIFFPLLNTEYVYTDEWVQLWLYKKGSDFRMFQNQGRYITDKLFQWLFSRAYTAHDVTWIRLFSLAGWMASVPVWYYIIKKIVVKENLPAVLVFFSVLFMICTPQFGLYVSWASCLEMFLANTSALVSGYLLYAAADKTPLPKLFRFALFAGSLIAGLISLFTYQNAFGCFMLPFVLVLAAGPGKWKMVMTGIAGYFALYIVYYFLFKLALSLSHIDAVERTRIAIDLFPKIRFFFGRALRSSFHFSYLFNEKDMKGFIVYVILFFSWIGLYFYRWKEQELSLRLRNFSMIIVLFVIIYLPSLIVKENYASNRTLFALNMAVFIIVAATAFKNVRDRQPGLLMFLFSLLFVLNARFNFKQQFLNPVAKEYRSVRGFIEANYKPGIDSFYFVQPEEDFFVRKFRITRSWDEFGVPSTFFNWVPEFFVKQIVFEKTGDRRRSDSMVIRQWLGRKEWEQAHLPVPPNVLLIDTEQIMAPD